MLNVFKRENFQRYKTNILFLAFNQAKETVSSKNAVRVLNTTVNGEVKKI